MKNLLIITFFSLGLCRGALAQNAAFDGLEKVMDREAYEKAGLGKLTPDERAVLDGFLRDYVAGKQKAAATVAAAEAVDRAVKERKVRPPEIIETRILGTFNGYGVRTIFHMANGETWKPSNGDYASFSPVENPVAIIYRDSFGYKMWVQGIVSVRVKRIN